MELPRIVLKFGGTSVQDADNIRAACRIVADRGAAAAPAKPLVVVSAAAGVTNELVRLLEVARGGGRTETAVAALHERHQEIVRDLDLGGLGGASGEEIEARVGELRDLLRGVELLREVTPRTWDLVLAYGEVLLAPIFAAQLSRTVGESRAWFAGDLGLITDDRFTRARPLPEAYERIPATLEAAEEHIPVVTGFAGRTLTGETTTLGRGGSDYSASIIARALDAQELQIWTDVDGILTADPRVVPQARLIENIGFGEASELAFSGAKVLHPQTIVPAMERGIPVRVLNTRHPERRGTLIVDDEEAWESHGESGFRSIAHRAGIHVVTIISPRMVARHGFLARIAEVFDRHGLSVDMISTSEVSVSLTTQEDPRGYPRLLADLESFSTIQVESGRGMISLVGARFGSDAQLFGDIFRTVADGGGAGNEARSLLEMISFGATKINLSFLVPEDRLHDIVRALHARYFERG